ncbi:HNH endonuclease [Ralstonia chuxiongensis]|uniref:HNH endonuclease n=1 Tax=Ralstonia chuxiongensis TaxID=2957504 RepID=A0AA41WZD5_9RALS|nr:hypothetical protein [Ralstonia chuxiongensis]MCP1175628.1 hypothetical protein [Ralstonia chuxiongensis]
MNEWLITEGLLGDAKFYTGEEWRTRGEQLHDEALLVLMIDGSALHTILNYGGDTSEFDDLIESFGFWYELGYSWSVGFYPAEDYDFSPLQCSYASKLKDQRWQRKAKLIKERAGYSCQDCGATAALDAHHCYYANMRHGFEPWEYPLGAFRALCRTCHEARERAEIRMRAFMASLTKTEMDSIRDALGHAFYWYQPGAVSAFLSALGPEERHILGGVDHLRLGRTNAN